MTADHNFEMTDGGLLLPKGRYHGVHLRNGEVIDEFGDVNRIVNEGLNRALDVMFRGTTQINPWYLGLFKGNYTPVATVTGATIATASTEATEYAEATRVQWQPAAAAAQQMSNSANRASFVFNASITVYGAFLVSTATKEATTGTLFSAARFATAKNVEAGDEILLTYNLSAASAQ